MCNRLHTEVIRLLDRVISLGVLSASAEPSGIRSLEDKFMKEMFDCVMIRLCKKEMPGIGVGSINESEKFQRCLDDELKKNQLSGGLATSLRNKYYCKFRNMILDTDKQKEREPDINIWLAKSLTTTINYLYSLSYSFTFTFVNTNKNLLEEFLRDSVLLPMLKNFCAWRDKFVLDSVLKSRIEAFMVELIKIYDTNAKEGQNKVLEIMNEKKMDFLDLKIEVDAKNMCINQITEGFFVPVNSDTSYCRTFICSVMRRWIYDQSEKGDNYWMPCSVLYPEIKELCDEIHSYITKNERYLIDTIEDNTRNTFQGRYIYLKNRWISYNCTQDLFEICFESLFVKDGDSYRFYEVLMTGDMALGISSNYEFVFMKDILNFIAFENYPNIVTGIGESRSEDSTDILQLIDVLITKGHLNYTLSKSVYNKYYCDFRNMIFNVCRQENDVNNSWVYDSLTLFIDNLFSLDTSCDIGRVTQNKTTLKNFLQHDVLSPMQMDFCVWRDKFVFDGGIKSRIAEFMAEVMQIYRINVKEEQGELSDIMNEKKPDFLVLKDAVGVGNMCITQIAEGFFVPVNSDPYRLRPSICNIMRGWIHEEAINNANSCKLFDELYYDIDKLCKRIRGYCGTNMNSRFYSIKDNDRDYFKNEYKQIRVKCTESGFNQSSFEICFGYLFVRDENSYRFYEALMTGDMAPGT